MIPNCPIVTSQCKPAATSFFTLAKIGNFSKKTRLLDQPNLEKGEERQARKHVIRYYAKGFNTTNIRFWLSAQKRLPFTKGQMNDASWVKLGQ
jgi:hypothetical protein